MDPLSRLVGRPHFEPSLPKGVLLLVIAANGPNDAISLTKTFDRILVMFVTVDICGTKSKKRGSGNNRDYRRLKYCFFLHLFRRIRCQPVSWSRAGGQTLIP